MCESNEECVLWDVGGMGGQSLVSYRQWQRSKHSNAVMR